MAILHNKKCAFVHIPKVGGTTILSVITQTYSVGGAIQAAVGTSPHEDVQAIKRHLGAKFDTYFKFGFVRNPWDRAVSVYSKRFNGEFKDFLRQLKNSTDFDQNAAKAPKRYYLDWFCDENGKQVVDFVGRFEHFERDLVHVCSKLGFVPKTIPRLGPSNHKHYTEYYDQEGIDIIRRTFDRDIEFFGYEFGE